ncbi:SAM-dependent methyltransferase [Evansella cellulosilytica]|uniref:SAM-dependent methyltransferase n=1 Tax=Evansella cellulosilytica (strain ATCC 21833 / DSM 2522 / FERM P-1141 / JCM 9156 / N-4) TaxID=649639 RepID=E6TWY3_EVAC2|nr:SAM-dependent methyltransferase [Evansella cellulosilytica]ADU29933.1 protein of unknown function DUF185 [Evansella cellulosilytica DSM 2522]
MNAINFLREKLAFPVTMEEYMRVSLYDEEIGYYMKDRVKLGKEGDFYTSNHVHPVFQKTFARFFLDVIKKEKISPYICEFGAGEGMFAKNVLDYFLHTDEKVYEKMQYIIIESSQYHRAMLLNILDMHKERVRIFSSMIEAKHCYPHLEGIIFSNELIDAFPVRVVEKHSNQLYEVLVDVNKTEVKEVIVPCKDNKLTSWLNVYGPDLADGYRFEINLAMREWLIHVNEWLRKGLVVTVDYGYTNEELNREERRLGSLRGYYKHQLIDDPLKYPSEMDMTSHIQWDAFQQISRELNLEEITHEKQDRFLLKAGLFTFLEKANHLDPFSESFKQNRAIQSLVYPGGISSSFQVNVQGKVVNEVKNYTIFTEDPYHLDSKLDYK